MKKIVSKKKSNTFGPRLRQLRTAAGFTQQEVADEVGVSLQTYNKWEMGRAGEPGFSELCTIAAMFGVQLNDFAIPENTSDDPSDPNPGLD
jgi:transcriptional regulator with XRE-family HTH domain